MIFSAVLMVVVAVYLTGLSVVFELVAFGDELLHRYNRRR